MAKNVRERAIAHAENADKRPHASAKYVRMSPSKAIRVLDVIRGKKYLEAVAVCENLTHDAAKVILKVVNSAAANAENNLGLSKDDLYVAECYANPGPILKRMMPRAKGRGDRILKRTTHIVVVLDTAK